MASLPTILLILAAVSLAATCLAGLVAFRSQREAHSAIFPIVREEETTRAQRARISIFVWIAVTALFFGGWLATWQLAQPGQASSAVTGTAVQENEPLEADGAAFIVDVTETPQPTTEPTTETEVETDPESLEIETTAQAEAEQAEPAPAQAEIKNEPATSTLASPKATPTAQTSATTSSVVRLVTPPSPTSTATPQPATPTPTETAAPPTATPTNTSTPEPPTPTPTSVLGALKDAATGPWRPAPADAKIGPIQFAGQITPDLDPVDPKEVFPANVKTIYAVFPFSGMSKDLDFTIVWYKNGAELARREGQWEWGAKASSYTFLTARGEGLYKLELYVHDSIMASKLFEIR